MMKYTYKTELRPTKQQIAKINQNMGVCRWLYNRYISVNLHLHKMYRRGFLDNRQKHFLSAIDFDKYINQKVKNKLAFAWIGKCGSKARKKAIVNAEKAYIAFFKQQAGFPRFKKKFYDEVKLYYPKSNKSDWTIKRNKIKVPTFGYIELKEKGYIPQNAKVINGIISCKAGRYFIHVLVERDLFIKKQAYRDGLRIDFSLEHFLVYGDGSSELNINKTKRVIKLKQRLSRAKRKLNRQVRYKIRYHIPAKHVTGNILKTQREIQVIYQRLIWLRDDYLNKVIAKIIACRPRYIILKDFKVNSLLEDESLFERVKEQKFFYFKARLLAKCKVYGIEVILI